MLLKNWEQSSGCERWRGETGNREELDSGGCQGKRRKIYQVHRMSKEVLQVKFKVGTAVLCKERVGEENRS